MKHIRHIGWLLAFAFACISLTARAEDNPGDFRIGQGDIIRIQVFQNPDLSLETRVAESGSITYPLLGSVQIGGQTISEAEKTIANALKEGGFVQQPQVNINLAQVRGNQVSVLGQVGRPGKYPLETFNSHLSEMLAVAGGINPVGADVVILTGVRDGKPIRREIDIPAMFLDKKLEDDVLVAGGDIIYVHRAPMFYIYGEVQRPGSFRIERGMTVQQALAQAGGPTMRGTENRLRLHRRNADGKVEKLSPELLDTVQADDVLYVRESLF